MSLPSTLFLYMYLPDLPHATPEKSTVAFDPLSVHAMPCVVFIEQRQPPDQLTSRPPKQIHDEDLTNLLQLHLAYVQLYSRENDPPGRHPCPPPFDRPFRPSPGIPIGRCPRSPQNHYVLRLRPIAHPLGPVRLRPIQIR